MEDQKSLLQNLSTGIAKKFRKITANRYGKMNLNWGKVKYLKHLPPGKLHHHSLLGHDFYFKNPSEFLYGADEIFVEEIYRQALPPNAFVLDCGAHIGLSVIYIKHICPGAEVVAFEPDKDNYELLKKNVKSYQLDNVHLRQEAVWTSDTTLNFHQDGTMGSKVTDSSTITTAPVKAVRLRDFINRDVDFLKLDIEGAEYEVLKDIARELHFVKRMFLEYHGTFAQNNELVDIFNILRETHFQFYIKEAAENHSQPFSNSQSPTEYDVQLNIFCFRK